MKRLFTRLAALLLFASLLGCQPKSVEPYTMTDSLKQDLTTVQSARIFFGHQSVGGNIMDGVQDLVKESGVRLNILDASADAGQLPASFLLHTPVGKNTEPKTKCDDFKRIIDRNLAGKIDIALLKFCYIDIDENTDVDKLFEYYRYVIDDLKLRHPDIIFIHVTAAMRHAEGGIGVRVRELMGKPNRTKLANLKRHAFNEKLRDVYAGEPMFDLEASESTYPDGSRESFKYDGKTGYSLIGAYTDDGGHLNALGRKYVAADFIRSIAAAVRAQRAPAS